MSFGEMVLLGQTTRCATVVADCEVVCRVLEADDIDRLAGDAPMLRIVLLENILAIWLKSCGGLHNGSPHSLDYSVSSVAVRAMHIDEKVEAIEGQ